MKGNLDKMYLLHNESWSNVFSKNKKSKRNSRLFKVKRLNLRFILWYLIKYISKLCDLFFIKNSIKRMSVLVSVAILLNE